MQSIFKVLNIIVHVHKPAKDGFSSRANDHSILTWQCIFQIRDVKQTLMNVSHHPVNTEEPAWTGSLATSVYASQESLVQTARLI